MYVSKIFVVSVCLFQTVFHPADHLKSLFQNVGVEGRIHEDVPQHSFAASTRKECFIGGNDWVALFADSLPLYQTRMQVFLRNLQKLKCSFGYLNELEQSVNKKFNIFDIQFFL
mgnify:CR=1 FL=1